MPQLRQDRFTGEWVFVATRGESQTLLELLPEAGPRPRPHFAESCPFCPKSAIALPEISSAHVAENAFPRIRLLLQPSPPWQYEESDPEMIRQEFLVESQDHAVNSALLPDAHYLSLFEMAKARYHELALDPRVKQITLEKNQCSGTLLQQHAHWRLSGLGKTASDLDVRLRTARHQFAETGRCVFCASLEEELQNGARVVNANRHFVTLEPFASLTPFSTFIYPRRHMAAFTELENGEVADLASSVRDIFVRFHSGLNDPDFTCRLNSAFAANRYFHWSFMVVPRLRSEDDSHGKLRMNAVVPERAAEYLRAIRVEQAIPA